MNKNNSNVTTKRRRGSPCKGICFPSIVAHRFIAAAAAPIDQTIAGVARTARARNARTAPRIRDVFIENSIIFINTKTNASAWFS
ncbi:hypothetical protein ACVBGC_23130 [Burkholderia stagnalis]